jgi:hypothetical protein
MGHIARNCSLI